MKQLGNNLACFHFSWAKKLVGSDNLMKNIFVVKLNVNFIKIVFFPSSLAFLPPTELKAFEGSVR